MSTRARMFVVVAFSFAIGAAFSYSAQRFGLSGRARMLVFGTTPAAFDEPRTPASAVEREKYLFASLANQRVVVLVCAGQSNAGNHGDTRAEGRDGVYNFHEKTLYAARDPLLGASGDGGSVWTRLGNRIVEAGLADSVVLVPCAVSNTRLDAWAPGGYLHPLLMATFRDLEAMNLTPTFVLWQQGESDTMVGTEAAAYEARFRELLASIREETDAPVYLATASLNVGHEGPEVRAAQRALIGSGEVKAGPDVDQLVGDRRNAGDRTHLSAKGLDECASGWLEAIREGLGPGR